MTGGGVGDVDKWSDSRKSAGAGFIGDFLARLALDLARHLGLLVLLFIMGTAVGAGVCLYYHLPIIFSLGGGLLAIAFAVGLALS